MSDGQLLLRKVEINITPTWPCILAGHAARRHRKHDWVLDRIYARAIILSSDLGTTAFVSMDLCEFEDSYVRRLRAAISKASGIAEDSILIACIHTHTAPAVIPLGDIPLETEYMEWLLDKTSNGIGEAMKSEGIPIKVFTATARADFGINRRYKDPITGQYSMKPNPEGSYDSSIPFVVFSDLNYKVQAIMYSCSVHPTTLGVTIFSISPDYPGSINLYLKQQFGEDVLTVAVTGACGDVRPALLDESGKSFRDGTQGDIDIIGEMVCGAIMSKLDRLKEVPGASSVIKTRSIPFEMETPPSKDEIRRLIALQDERIGEARKKAEKMTEFERSHEDPLWTLESERKWLEWLLTLDKTENVFMGQVALWTINDGVAVFCVPGELFTDVGLRLESMWKGENSMIAGYCNGSVGYMPSAEAVKEGGYETKDAFKHLPGHTGAFTEQLEQSLVDTMKSFIG